MKGICFTGIPFTLPLFLFGILLKILASKIVQEKKIGKQEGKVFTFPDSVNLCIKTLTPPITNSKILYFEQSKLIENSAHKKKQ